MKNSLIIFLLQYNLQRFSLFDFYNTQGGRGSERGEYSQHWFVTNIRRLTGRLCRRFQLIKLRPTHWAICFLWPRCCFSHFLAKTKCDSHYYRVLSSLSQSLSSLFLIPFGRRCKNVVAVVVARRHYYYCFYRSFVLLSATPCVHSSAKMDLFFTTWLLWLRLITNITQHEMLLPFFCSPFLCCSLKL